MADGRFQVASLLIAVILSLLTLLEAHLTPLRLLFVFLRREQDIIRLLSLPIAVGPMTERLGRSLPKPRQDQDEFKHSGTTLICREESNRARMEGIKENIRFKSVFKTDTRCGVDGRKRYGNDKCGRKSS